MIILLPAKTTALKCWNSLNYCRDYDKERIMIRVSEGDLIKIFHKNGIFVFFTISNVNNPQHCCERSVYVVRLKDILYQLGYGKTNTRGWDFESESEHFILHN